jgi:hypothetical protein
MKDYPKLPSSAMLKSPSGSGSSSTAKEVGGMKKGSSGPAVKKVMSLASKAKGMKGMNPYC